MKKTPQPKTAAAPPATTPIAIEAPLRATHPPSEYTLLARAMQDATPKERQFIYEVLEDFVQPGLPVAEAALQNASVALGLGLQVEGISEFAEDFKAFSRVTLDQDWLYRFLHMIFRYVNEGKTPTPEDVMAMAELYLLELENNIDCARQTISAHPEAFSKEIRQAVAAHPELLSNAG